MNANRAHTLLLLLIVAGALVVISADPPDVGEE